MQITIENPEQFVTHNGNIGIVLYSREQDTHVNFFTEDMKHIRVNREQLGSPSLVDLKLELNENSQLRYIAEHNNVITVNHQHKLDFLEYALSYN